MISFIDLAAVLGFVLSVANFIIYLFSVRVSIEARKATIIQLPRINKGVCILLETILVNKSGKPVSITGARLRLVGDSINYVECVENIPFSVERNGVKVRITSSFPIHLDAYVSRRIVLEVPHQQIAEEVLRLAKAGNPRPEGYSDTGPYRLYGFELLTSRRKKFVPFFATVTPFGEWWKSTDEVS